ncbi:MAG: TIGR03986 family CRISPR-associated RAMP protein [Cyanobacteria bacterium CRU_2_1]|nr:TIGR03986 family CRISPR-associated RAMP protein [Cyanobacteria bacterium CRU_2_1]
MSDFHNPYNFIPALPREGQHPDLDDALPSSHGKYHADRWSGRIAVTLTTKTPLLIPDAAGLKEKGERGKEHKTYPLRIGSDGKPYLPATSIKGMLRSAYEAITNSRLSVFSKHGDRLAYRMAAEGQANQTIYPARVEQRNGELQLRILRAPDLFDKAGKLPRYKTYKNRFEPRELDKGLKDLALTYADSKDCPQHGDSVWVRLNPRHEWEHELSDLQQRNLKIGLKPKRNGSINLPKSVVTRIARREENSEKPGNGEWHKGWVCITGANMSGKRYERVFIESEDDPFIPIDEQIKALWEELIANYQKEHERDPRIANFKRTDDRDPRIRQPQDYMGDNTGDTAWSNHIYQPNLKALKPETLCYVDLSQELSGTIPAELPPGLVKALIPVMLSRRLYESSPADLLPESLHPAENLSELSPADRVFGWVRQKPGKPDGEKPKETAYKGNLRIHGVVCDCSKPEDVIHPLGEEGLPLAILGQPKEQQARFYAARNQQGLAYRNPSTGDQRGFAKEQTYQASQNHEASQKHGLRGRKVYPHHDRLPKDYWDTSLPELTQMNGRYQEYRRLTDEGSNRDSQNRSIQAWVKENVVFKFEIDVTNLSSVELGALLWLLHLDEGQHHRLGGGKPLGLVVFD